MIDWGGWLITVAGVLIVTAIVAGWKLVANKADKLELRNGIKEINVRIDRLLEAIAAGVSKTDLIDKLSIAASRVDDKDQRVQRDIAELKSDLKTVVQTVTVIDKRLDELPARVMSLETTRNKQEGRIAD